MPIMSQLEGLILVLVLYVLLSVILFMVGYETFQLVFALLPTPVLMAFLDPKIGQIGPFTPTIKVLLFFGIYIGFCLLTWIIPSYLHARGHQLEHEEWLDHLPPF